MPARVPGVRDQLADDMLTTLKALQEWAAMMGGWEAPVWELVDRVVAAAEGRPIELEEA
jgi:hypothetical protein